MPRRAVLQELAACGALAFYDKAADRVTPKMPAKVRAAALLLHPGVASYPTPLLSLMRRAGFVDALPPRSQPPALGCLLAHLCGALLRSLPATARA